MDTLPSEIKPIFLTKEQRAELAIAKRQQEVGEKRIKQDEERKARESLLEKRSIQENDNNRLLSRNLNNKELEVIRDRYIGPDKSKRRIRRTNDKKFIFDWDASEDTQVFASSSLPKTVHNNHSFGRGMIAGIDEDVQRVKSESYMKSVILRDSDRLQDRFRKKTFEDRNWRDKRLNDMIDRDWRILREDFNISTQGGHMPRPLRYWEEAEFSDSIKDVIESLGYTDPTPIQRQSIPIGLQNRDLIGVAETGSGKTAAFVIPMLAFIMKMPKISVLNMNDGPYAIILAPTRELVQQIEGETIRFARPLGFKCVSIVGGHLIDAQAAQLRNGAEIIIATPGRLRDCLERRMIVFNQCSYVVMDEADRMIDLGFEVDVNFILSKMPVSNLKPDTDDAEDPDKMFVDGLPKYRQTTMFSATMPDAVAKLAKAYLRRPATVIIGTAGKAVETVQQRVEFVNDEKKRDRLMQILNEDWKPPIIIFVNQKKGVDVLAKAVENGGFRTTTLHGGKSQDTREVALQSLRTGQKDILVATDVAGRGIDVQDVSLVINYDMAKNIESNKN